MPRLETRIVLCNKVGLHARPAALFETATKLKSTIRVIKDSLPPSRFIGRFSPGGTVSSRLLGSLYCFLREQSAHLPLR